MSGSDDYSLREGSGRSLRDEALRDGALRDGARPKPKVEVPLDENETYDVREPVEEEVGRPSRLMPGLRTLSDSGEILSEAERPRPGALREPLVPPRWTFFSGVVQMPFYRDSWRCWLGLSAGLLAVLLMGSLAVVLGSMANQLTWIVSMIWFGITFAIGWCWAAVATAYCLAIIRDTAEGYDQIENWPEPVFLDWMLEVLYIFNALGVAALVGMGAGWLFEQIGWIPAIGAVGGMFLAFPVVFLSMLEMNSPLKPFSLPVWQSLVEHWRGWVVFYAESAVLMLLAVVVFRVAVQSFVTLLVGSPVLVILLMIQARLFGRLVWYCGGKRMPRQT